MKKTINSILEYSSKLNILYIEDSKEIQEHMSFLLNNFFNEVVVADDGRDGLNKFIEYHTQFGYYPDVVLTDISMPNMCGVDMSREMLLLNKEQTIIVLSAHNDSEILLELISLGISHFLSKPLDNEQLYSTLYKATKQIYLEKKESEYKKQIENAIKEVELASKIKDEFLANMSHEIRTPMNAIIGLSHILLDSNLSGQQFDYISKIKSSADLLLGIINDILDFSKIEAGKLDIENIEFDLNKTLDNVSNLISMKAKDKNLELIFNIDNSVPAMIKGDPLRLAQVLINLMNNAVKFTELGEVELKVKMLSLDSSKQFLQFEVEDSGIGLREEQIEKLFKSFSQADSSTTRKYGGTGLGLSISKQLVELMGGKIWVESDYGKGSKFIFTIETQKLERRSYRLPSRDLMSKKVLIVDSNTKSSSALMKMLEYFQFVSLCASDINEAQNMLTNNKFDIVFVDSKIVNISSSFNFKFNNSTKIVYMQSTVENRIESEINGLKIDINLQKPFNQQMIFSSIVNLFSNTNVDNFDNIKNQELKDSIRSLRGSKIILAEDNIINQTIILGLLEGSGIEVIIANNGKEVLDKLLVNSNIDMIFMDVNMPIMSGYEAIEEIRKNHDYDNIPLITLSANARQKDIDKAKKFGVSEYLTKPIDVELFYTFLLKYIDKRCEISDTTVNIENKISNENLDNILNEISKYAKKRKAITCNKLAYQLQNIEYPSKYSNDLNNIVNLLKRYKFKEVIAIIESMK